MSIRDNYYIYHLTAFENMRSILLYGLLPRKQLPENAFTDVADPQIMAYRKENYLDEYVPFHFLGIPLLQVVLCEIVPENMFILP